MVVVEEANGSTSGSSFASPEMAPTVHTDDGSTIRTPDGAEAIGNAFAKAASEADALMESMRNDSIQAKERKRKQQQQAQAHGAKDNMSISSLSQRDYEVYAVQKAKALSMAMKKQAQDASVNGGTTLDDTINTDQLEDINIEFPMEQEPTTNMEKAPADLEKGASASRSFGKRKSATARFMEVLRSSSKRASEVFEEEPISRGTGDDDDGISDRGSGILDMFRPSAMHLVKTDDEEGMEEEPIFGEDAYSIIGIAPIFSQASAFAWFVIMLQAGMLLVTLLDLIDFDDDAYSINGVPNRMQVPAGASIYVTISQFFGLLLTVLVMAAEGDMVNGFSQLFRGYHPKLMEKNPNVTFAKWLFTGLFQASTGALLLLNSFILSMRSTTVIDLALNITALHFLQEFDEKAFEIATDTGLLGTQIKEECEKIGELTHFTTPQTRRRYIVWKRILIGIMTFMLLLPYFIIVAWQNSGRYMCNTLYVQFGDAYLPEMAHYSGIFVSQGNGFTRRKDSRAFYVDETYTFQIAYCRSKEAWTISRLDGGGTCDYIFKSPDTDTFDVIQVANADWVVRTPNSGDVEVDWLKIRCNDCREETCNSEFGTCSSSGDQCICNEGRFGVNCQFDESCKRFAIDQRSKEGLASIPGTAPLLGKEYISFGDGEISFFDRPVYVPYNKTSKRAEEDVTSFIIFTGRRWAVYSIPDVRLPRVVAANNKASNWTSQLFYDDLIRYNSEGSNLWAMQYLTSDSINYFPIFFSSPADFGEESDGVDPSTVNWVFAKDADDDIRNIISRIPDDQQPLLAKLLCSDCDSGTECQNGGFCELGECVCPSIYAGFMCERIKDCVEAGGCNNAGTCNEAIRVCECNEGSFGSLCQLGESKLEDEFLCARCNLYGQGECNSTFSQECACQEGYYGVFCNETDTP